jgi:hypothetical protein
MADPDQKLGRESISVQSVSMPPARLDPSTRNENDRAPRLSLVHRQEPTLYLACLEVVDDNGHSMAIAKRTLLNTAKHFNYAVIRAT